MTESNTPDTSVTCSASRHVMTMADDLTRDGYCLHIAEEPRHCAESMRAVVKALWAARREAQGLMQTLRDEIDENLRLRELGGARPDENITAMTERIIRERDQFRDAAKLVPGAAESVTCTNCGFETWIMYGKATAQITDADKRNAAPQPVGEVPMPEAAFGRLSLRPSGVWVTDKRGMRAFDDDQMQTYGDAREAAGYAAGVAAERERTLNQCIAHIETIDDGDSPAYRHCQEALSALRGEVK